MKPALRRLVQNAGDRTDAVRQLDAARQLWLFLEMKNRPRTSPEGLDLYEKEVPDDLRSAALEHAEEQELVDALHRLVVVAQSGTERRSLMSPLGTARPGAAIGPLLDLLRRRGGEGWPNEDARSILIALENVLDVMRVPPSHRFYPERAIVAAAVRDHDPWAQLDELAAVPDDRLAEIAQRVRDKVEEAFNDGLGPSR